MFIVLAFFLTLISNPVLAASVSNKQTLTPVPLSLRLPEGKEVLDLKSGQIIMTDSGGPSAVFFSLFTEDFTPYIHSGIIVMENNRAFVYESYGTFQPALGGRPTDYIKGEVSRTPLEIFVQRGKFAKIYNPPPDADPQKIADFVVEQHRLKTPFDPYFRFDEHESLYCTELVALAIEAAGGKLPELSPFPDNPSLTIVREWLGITDKGTIQAKPFIDPERLVGTLSVLDSQIRFAVYIELKREIHRRFTRNQKLGNLFQWKNSNLEFRMPIILFLSKGLHLYEKDEDIPSRKVIKRDIRKLANEMFGPLNLQ